MSKTVEYLTKTCVGCGNASTVLVDERQLRRWQSGEFAQRVFTDWTDEQRELLISGTHAACWQRLFGDDEEH